MNHELFQVPKRLSPRLAWMEKHKIQTLYAPKITKEGAHWCAFVGEFVNAIFAGNVIAGETEQDALAALAVKLRIRLWNEEVLDPAKNLEGGE